MCFFLFLFFVVLLLLLHLFVLWTWEQQESREKKMYIYIPTICRHRRWKQCNFSENSPLAEERYAMQSTTKVIVTDRIFALFFVFCLYFTCMLLLLASFFRIFFLCSVSFVLCVALCYGMIHIKWKIKMKTKREVISLF